MEFNRNLVYFEDNDVFYDGIKLKITRQNIQDYMLQTGFGSESIIIFYYKKELQQLRDKILDKILDSKNETK
jgi:hypothetical protein